MKPGMVKSQLQSLEEPEREREPMHSIDVQRHAGRGQAAIWRSTCSTRSCSTTGARWTEGGRSFRDVILLAYSATHFLAIPVGSQNGLGVAIQNELSYLDLGQPRARGEKGHHESYLPW